MTDLDKLRALAEAATAGPWEADHREVSQSWTRPEPWQTIASNEVACMAYCYGGSGRGIERPEDAEFIAAANPATVLGLLDRIEAVEELHRPRIEDALTGDCAAEECDHEDECPTAEFMVCAECWRMSEEADAYFMERSLAPVLYPCPTAQALRGES